MKVCMSVLECVTVVKGRSEATDFKASVRVAGRQKNVKLFMGHGKPFMNLSLKVLGQIPYGSLIIKWFPPLPPPPIPIRQISCYL